MKLLRALIPLALFAAVAVFLAMGLGLNPSEVPSPLIGKPAPAFALPQLVDGTVTGTGTSTSSNTTTNTSTSTSTSTGQPLSREDLLGKVWMLNVWASWCAPCREEHPLVVDIAQRKLVPVYGLNYKDAPAAATQWLRQLGNPYTGVLVDADGRVGIDFGVYGVPETFIIDRQGIVRFKHVGPLNAGVVRDKIEPLLRTLNAPG